MENNSIIPDNFTYSTIIKGLKKDNKNPLSKKLLNKGF